MTERIDRFFAEEQPETPCLVVDTHVIAENYRRLEAAIPAAKIYYAVKANPGLPVLQILKDLGSYFDTASIYEIEQCLALGIEPERLSYGNTIKKARDIALAFEKGVNLFAFDSQEELDKLVKNAPGARVFCRMFMNGAGADWPLSRKFGCEMELAADLLIQAAERGLDAYGASFHVGSQQTDPGQWDIALAKTRMLFTTLEKRGINLRMINLGGGFPARYRTDVPDQATYGTAIMEALARHFGNRLPELIVEPGRGIAGDAGVLRSEVVLVSRKGEGDPVRWVFLDVGKFGGLPETMGEAIKYRIRTSRDGDATGPVVLAGPTCDEVDVLYQNHRYDLPETLRAGDIVDFMATGAYTATYSSVGFNGFPPLRTHYI